MNTPQLHHCTKYDSLCSILKSGEFWPSYCLEQSDFMKEFTEAAHSVVCFADLLPDEVERHAANFNSDSYIVMSKEWALRNYIAPVIYYYPSNITAVAFQKWVKFCIDKELPLSKEPEDILLSNSTNLMFAYMKQYEGVYFDDNKDKFSEEKRVFYLEREWRWVPLVKNGEAYYLPKKSFLDKNIRKGKRQELINHGYTLKFTPEDVIKVGIHEEQVDAFKKKFGEKYKVKPL